MSEWCALAHSLSGEHVRIMQKTNMFASCKKQLSWFYYASLAPLGMKWACICAGNGRCVSMCWFVLCCWLPIIALFDILTVPNSALFRSFLMTMCMLAPESTENSLSSGFIVEAAGKLHSSLGEKNVAASFSLSLKIFLASLQASPRAHRSCLAQSILEICRQIS